MQLNFTLTATVPDALDAHNLVNKMLTSIRYDTGLITNYGAQVYTETELDELSPLEVEEVEEANAGQKEEESAG